jgi:hypothetical protein
MFARRRVGQVVFQEKADFPDAEKRRCEAPQRRRIGTVGGWIGKDVARNRTGLRCVQLACHHRGEVRARTVAAKQYRDGSSGKFGSPFADPTCCLKEVIDGGRKFVFRREAVIDRRDGAAALLGQYTREVIDFIHTAQHEAAAVRPDEDGVGPRPRAIET